MLELIVRNLCLTFIMYLNFVVTKLVGGCWKYHRVYFIFAGVWLSYVCRFEPVENSLRETVVVCGREKRLISFWFNWII